MDVPEQVPLRYLPAPQLLHSSDEAAAYCPKAHCVHAVAGSLSASA